MYKHVTEIINGWSDFLRGLNGHHHYLGHLSPSPMNSGFTVEAYFSEGIGKMVYIKNLRKTGKYGCGTK